MKFLEHVKLAACIGLIAGILHGTIDAASKMLMFSFEWFELYQSMLIPMILFTSGFVVLSFFIEIIRKTIKPFARKALSRFYITVALSFIALFLLIIHLKDFIPYTLALLIPALLIGLTDLCLLTKGRKKLSGALSYGDKKHVGKLLKNYAFLIIFFVMASFFMDAYLLNYQPGFTPSSKLDGYPNVILISMDTTRADHLSLYGYPVETSPNLDRFAEKSVVFSNAISVSPWTLPAHAAMFTGRYPSSTNLNATGGYDLLKSTETTLAEVLRDRGYNTAGFISGAYCKAKYGLGQGFLLYRDRVDFFEYFHTFNKFSIRRVISFISDNLNKQLFGTDSERTSPEVNNDVFNWLDTNSEKTPFFLFVHYFDPHHPYNLGSEFREQFTNKTIESDKVEQLFYETDRYEDVPEDVLEYMIELYDTEIFYLDYHIGQLLEKLDELGVKDNTIIIITADHGEEFYDHGDFNHARTLYEEVLHVPLIIYYGGKFEPQVIEGRVGTIDIFPTILDILQMDIPDNLESASLLPLIKNKSGYDSQYVFSELIGNLAKGKSKQKAVTYGDWKLIEMNPSTDVLPSSLFNLKTDPDEQKNFYNSYEKKREELQSLIDEITHR